MILPQSCFARVPSMFTFNTFQGYYEFKNESPEIETFNLLNMPNIDYETSLFLHKNGSVSSFNKILEYGRIFRIPH